VSPLGRGNRWTRSRRTTLPPERPALQHLRPILSLMPGSCCDASSASYFRDAVKGLPKASAPPIDEATTAGIRTALADARATLKERNAGNTRLRSDLTNLAGRVAIRGRDGQSRVPPGLAAGTSRCEQGSMKKFPEFPLRLKVSTHRHRRTAVFVRLRLKLSPAPLEPRRQPSNNGDHWHENPNGLCDIRKGRFEHRPQPGRTTFCPGGWVVGRRREVACHRLPLPYDHESWFVWLR
jgi:hypothetical protein